MTTPPLDLTNTEWRTFQQIADQGYSHRAWIDNRIRERVTQAIARATAAEAAIARVREVHAKVRHGVRWHCDECLQDDGTGSLAELWPCPTITALDTHTPETETTP